jgi:hypothetical protein
MRSGESTAIAGLDAYLDGVSAGRLDAAILALVESDLVEADTGLRAMDDTPHPGAAFVDRLEESLLRTASLSAPAEPVVPRVTDVSDRPTRTQVLAHAPRGRLPGWPWAPGELATAALLVLTLVGSYLAFGAARPDQERQQAPSVPAPESGRVLLAEMPLSRDAIPDPFDLEVMRFRIEPDREAIITADRWAELPGASIAYVLAGQLTLRVEAPFRVTRADTPAPEEIAAGTEVVLGIGDTAMFPFEAARTYANPGPEPVELLQGNVMASGGWLHDLPSGFYTLAGGDLSSLPASVIPAALPGPLVLRLERVAVESPELFPPSSVQGADGVQASLLEPSASGARTPDRQGEMAYVLTLAPAFASLDAQDIRNANDDVARVHQPEFLVV